MPAIARAQTFDTHTRHRGRLKVFGVRSGLRYHTGSRLAEQAGGAGVEGVVAAGAGGADGLTGQGLEVTVGGADAALPAAGAGAGDGGQLTLPALADQAASAAGGGRAQRPHVLGDDTGAAVQSRDGALTGQAGGAGSRQRRAGERGQPGGIERAVLA